MACFEHTDYVKNHEVHRNSGYTGFGNTKEQRKVKEKDTSNRRGVSETFIFIWEDRNREELVYSQFFT
jgi:hypothetical protein